MFDQRRQQEKGQISASLLVCMVYLITKYKQALSTRTVCGSKCIIQNRSILAVLTDTHELKERKVISAHFFSARWAGSEAGMAQWKGPGRPKLFILWKPGKQKEEGGAERERLPSKSHISWPPCFNQAFLLTVHWALQLTDACRHEWVHPSRDPANCQKSCLWEDSESIWVIFQIQSTIE